MNANLSVRPSIYELTKNTEVEVNTEEESVCVDYSPAVTTCIVEDYL